MVFQYCSKVTSESLPETPWIHLWCFTSHEIKHWFEEVLTLNSFTYRPPSFIPHLLIIPFIIRHSIIFVTPSSQVQSDLFHPHLILNSFESHLVIFIASQTYSNSLKIHVLFQKAGYYIFIDGNLSVCGRIPFIDWNNIYLLDLIYMEPNRKDWVEIHIADIWYHDWRTVPGYRLWSKAIWAFKRQCGIQYHKRHSKVIFVCVICYGIPEGQSCKILHSMFPIL